MALISVIVAAICSMAIGMFWYSRAGFGKSWMKEIGMTEKKMKNMALSPAQGMTLGFLGTLLAAYVLAKVLGMTGLAGLLLEHILAS